MSYHSDFWMTVGAASPVIAFAQAVSLPRVFKRSLAYVKVTHDQRTAWPRWRREGLFAFLGVGMAITAWGAITNVIGFFYALAAVRWERDNPWGMLAAYWGAVSGMVALGYQLMTYLVLDIDVVSDGD